jgi:dihydroorotate dehydrogenase
LNEFADDFACCAAWAVEAGAHAIEANLSCPNVCSAEGTLYKDFEASRVVTRRMRDAIGSVPLLLKLGAFPSDDAMARLFRAVNGLADGVTMVNCLSRPVLYPNGEPVFGARFRTAGVLGRAIHRPSVEIVRAARECIDRDGLALQIAAVGGASTIDDIADFFQAGADAVLCGSSPMYLPDLAIDAKRAHSEW